MFAVPSEARWWEDYVPGTVHELGSVTVDQAGIIGFARQFDPQPFHLDPEAARRSPYGGLIASGWHTAALAMRMLVDGFLAGAASLGSPGVDEVRWLHPVRPGDTLSLRVEILEARRSRSKPEQGIVRTRVEVLNQAGAVVMHLVGTNFIRCRSPG
jgi:acyl dehydratase